MERLLGCRVNPLPLPRFRALFKTVLGFPLPTRDELEFTDPDRRLVPRVELGEPLRIGLLRLMPLVAARVDDVPRVRLFTPLVLERDERDRIGLPPEIPLVKPRFDEELRDKLLIALELERVELTPPREIEPERVAFIEPRVNPLVDGRPVERIDRERELDDERVGMDRDNELPPDRTDRIERELPPKLDLMDDAPRDPRLADIPPRLADIPPRAPPRIAPPLRPFPPRCALATAGCMVIQPSDKQSARRRIEFIFECMSRFLNKFTERGDPPCRLPVCIASWAMTGPMFTPEFAGGGR